MSENQISMLRERIRSVGISLLGGNSGVEGKYELGIDSIRLVNEEDVDTSESNNQNQLIMLVVHIHYVVEERLDKRLGPDSTSD